MATSKKLTITIPKKDFEEIKEFANSKDMKISSILRRGGKELISRETVIGGLNMIDEKMNCCLGITTVRNAIIIPGLKFLGRAMERGNYSEEEEAAINLVEERLEEIHKFLIDKTDEIYQKQQERIREQQEKAAVEQKQKEAELKIVEEKELKSREAKRLEEAKLESERIKKVQEEEARMKKEIAAGKIVEF